MKLRNAQKFRMNTHGTFISFKKLRVASYHNTQIELSNGIMHVKWYRKASSKNIISHANSVILTLLNALLWETCLQLLRSFARMETKSVIREE